MSIDVHLCSVYMSVIAWRRICTFIKYQCSLKHLVFDYYFVIGSSQGELHMSFKFGKEIQSIKGGSPKWVFIYFGGFKHFGCYYFIVYYSLEPVLVI